MYALEGIKVLDLSRVLAGPWCTQTLADLGADVWKVETPQTGDDTRSWMPPDIGGESTYFLACNRSKRSIAVDFKTPEGRKIVRDMAERADVVVENFRLGALARYGLDYESLSRANPRLIYCSISGYGRTGPRADEAGYDFAIQAESGLMSITGEVDGEPMKLGVAITDIVTGMNATQAVLAALIARERTGQGQFIDLSLLDCAVSVLANVASAYLATGKPPRRYGNAHATVVPYQTFRTADGVLALAVGNDRQFATLCREVLLCPELADDPRFATNRARTTNIAVLEPILAGHFAGRSLDQLLSDLRGRGIPAGSIRDLEAVFAAPEIAARGMVAEVTDSLHGSVKLMTSPLKLSGTPVRAPAYPPRLGEHTDELLRDVLGLNPGEIADLRTHNAVG